MIKTYDSDWMVLGKLSQDELETHRIGGGRVSGESNNMIMEETENLS